MNQPPIFSHSKEQTQKIAAKFSRFLQGGEILCFYGELGTGKTTFIQGLAKGLGIKENVTSPTFILLKKYPFFARQGRASKGKPKKINFYHLDCYRLNSPQEAIDLGIEEIWNDKNNILAIEWADKIADILPEKRIDLCFEHIAENTRKITIFK